MRILRLETMDDEEWERAAADLMRGSLACLPTDTVYGIACVPDSLSAVDRLCEVKGRGKGKPLAVVISDITTVPELLPELPAPVLEAVRALLPGPVTAIVPAMGQEAVSLGEALGSPGSLGIRVMPPPFDDIYRRLPTPLALTSANQAGGPDPCSLDEVPEEIMAACEFAVDAGRCPLSAPSTVVDLRPLAEGRPASILREGAITRAEVESLLPPSSRTPE